MADYELYHIFDLEIGRFTNKNIKRREVIKILGMETKDASRYCREGSNYQERYLIVPSKLIVQWNEIKDAVKVLKLGGHIVDSDNGKRVAAR